MKWTRILGSFIGVVLLVPAVGCGGHAEKKTTLELVAVNPYLHGLGSKVVFHLRCNPPGGDIAHPARACAALEQNPNALLHPKPANCSVTAFNFTISGRFEGRPVNVKTTSCWTSQMKLLDLLGIVTQFDTHLVS